VKPHPRIRKTVKWGGAVVSVLFLTIWISSRWWHLGYKSRGGTWAVGVDAGTVVIGYARPGVWSNPHGFLLRFLDPPLHFAWWFNSESQPLATWWSVPLWVPTVPLLLATCAAWRLDAIARRRGRPGHCAACGYDLTGNTSGVCPECGAAAAQPRPVDGVKA
jgi:hypothetical protein